MVEHIVPFILLEDPSRRYATHMDNHETLRDWVEAIFERRKEQNPAYSLRALARDTQVPASRLSEFLQGKRNLSVKNLQRVCSELKLSEGLRQQAQLRSQLKASRSKRQTDLLQQKLNDITQTIQRSDISLEQFQACSHWIHLGILELLGWERKWSAHQLAQHLDLPELDVQAALTRLKRLNLVFTKGGQWQARTGQTLVRGGVPSDAIRAFHTGLIQKSLKAVTQQTLEERSLRSMVFALQPKDIPELNQMIQEFYEKVSRRFSRPTNQSRLYALTQQLFALDKKGENQ